MSDLLSTNKWKHKARLTSRNPARRQRMVAFMLHRNGTSTPSMGWCCSPSRKWLKMGKVIYENMATSLSRRHSENCGGCERFTSIFFYSYSSRHKCLSPSLLWVYFFVTMCYFSIASHYRLRAVEDCGLLISMEECKPYLHPKNWTKQSPLMKSGLNFVFLGFSGAFVFTACETSCLAAGVRRLLCCVKAVLARLF